MEYFSETPPDQTLVDLHQKEFVQPLGTHDDHVARDRSPVNVSLPRSVGNTLATTLTCPAPSIPRFGSGGRRQEDALGFTMRKGFRNLLDIYECYVLQDRKAE